MSLDDRELVEQYTNQNPGATVAEVAGALEIAPPKVAEFIDELQGTDTDAPLDYKGGSYPHLNSGFESWVCWMYIDDRKQPFAPYSDLPRHNEGGPDKFSWSNPENLTEFETAREWGRMHPDMRGIGFVLQDKEEPYKEPADPTLLIDLDDVIDPETGTMHPYARELVFDRAGSYADLSVSKTGAHIIGVGELPDGVRTIQDDLPEHPDFPEAEIEVYDGKRFCAMTGYWLTETSREVNDISGVISELVDEFETTDNANVSNGAVESIEIDNVEFTDTDTTDDFDELISAIKSVGPSDIRIKSPVTNEQSDGSVSRDPAWPGADSKSGCRIGEFNDGWVYRDGMIGLDALQLVALEEQIITSPHDYPEGERFWKAVEKLRERGANIPRYEKNLADRYGLNEESNSTEDQRRKALRAMRASQRGG